MQADLRKMNRKLWLLGLFKIPMIGFVRPKLLHLNDQEVEVIIKLRRRTKNHMGSMYFGALSVGADLAAGIHAVYFAEKMGVKIAFAFKNIQGEFLQRAESDVVFKSTAGPQVQEMIHKSQKQHERINAPIHVNAYNRNGELVGEFTMGLSIKVVQKQ